MKNQQPIIADRRSSNKNKNQQPIFGDLLLNKKISVSVGLWTSIEYELIWGKGEEGGKARISGILSS